MTGETIAVVGYVAVAGGLLLADAVGAIPNLDGFNLGQIGSVGFAIWYGWYTTCRAIPRIIDQHAASSLAVETKHQEQVRELTMTFKGEMAAIRDARERDRDHFQCDKNRP